MSDADRWQIVAISSEITSGPFRVKRMDGDIVLFRSGDSRCHALLDRCAHRRVPLSLGHVTAAGLIECPYHGWRYDGATGQCREIPNLSREERVPKSVRVPVYYVRESGGFVLIWSGASPPETMPRDFVTSDMFADVLEAQFGRTRLACPATLLLDALLDAPSALIGWTGLTILDHHRWGDPVVVGNHLRVAFSVCSTRTGLKVKAADDPPFILVLHVPLSDGPIRLMLTDAAGCALATVELAMIARDRRVSDVVWRSHGPMASRFRLDGTLDVDRLDRAGDHVSGYRHAAASRASGAALWQE